MSEQEKIVPACFALSSDPDGDDCVLTLRLCGPWLLSEKRPELSDILASVDIARYTSIRFDVEHLEEWDTGLLIFIRACQDWASENDLSCELDGLPEGVQNLVRLSLAIPKNTNRLETKARSWLLGLGEHSLGFWGAIEGFFAFLGELTLDFFELLRGRAQLRREDFFYLLQSTGPMALPIVSLLSFLTGLIIAFIGVIQLQKFAADIYVADLVGLATTRELGAVMAGVIMAGRTGAAFAAQIGSMKVNEEIDALTTFGISPMQFLVLPRVLALVLMMPLLCACADFVSILGGMVVAIAISDVGVVQYVNQVDNAVALSDFLVGLFKSVVFGVIIAVSGCYRGLNSGKDATAVGLATTSAVVTAITWIVVADAIFAVLFQMIGI
ncbi:MAG: ABC transporter permease [Verrucomicrobiota bacterium]